MRYRIGGNISNVTPGDLVNCLKLIFTNVKHRPRVFGYDIEFSNEQLELFISTFDEEEYNIDITAEMNESELLLLMNKLKIEFLKLNSPFNIGYYLEGDDGNHNPTKKGQSKTTLSNFIFSKTIR